MHRGFVYAMKSNSMTSIAPCNSMSSFHAASSPPISTGLLKIVVQLDAAVEYLMVHKNFQSAFDTCERGFENLEKVAEEEDSRYGDLKASLCTVGIQALAELNQWRGVLGWVLQHFGSADTMPTKIMQMCILLYSKVGEHATMQEVGHSWLHCLDNTALSGYGTVAELYLLHVLIPLGLTAEAQQLVTGDVGSAAFTADQRQVALDLIESQQSSQEGQTQSPSPEATPQMITDDTMPHGSVIQRLHGMLRLLQRGVSIARLRWKLIPVRRFLLTVFLLYLLLVRMDPALPSSFPWVLKLLRLLKQMWYAMFGPYYRANAAV
ncbi:peroxisome assembly protein 26 [Alosa alosa]|nr:peroxisome assembly protein 26 [Alosa alosa]